MSGSNPTRIRWLIAIALGILGIYAVICVSDARSASARLQMAQQDLQEVNSKLSDIQRLQQAPKVAALELESSAEIANRIAAALIDAGLTESTLMKEEPSDPQRVQRTDFEIRSTVIELAPATLPEILRFCHELRDAETGTVVRDITLTAPRSGANGEGKETWESELVLTQMIFSPKSR